MVQIILLDFNLNILSDDQFSLSLVLTSLLSSFSLHLYILSSQFYGQRCVLYPLTLVSSLLVFQFSHSKLLSPKYTENSNWSTFTNSSYSWRALTFKVTCLESSGRLKAMLFTFAAWKDSKWERKAYTPWYSHSLSKLQIKKDFMILFLTATRLRWDNCLERL